LPSETNRGTRSRKKKKKKEGGATHPSQFASYHKEKERKKEEKEGSPYRTSRLSSLKWKGRTHKKKKREEEKADQSGS